MSKEFSDFGSGDSSEELSFDDLLSGGSSSGGSSTSSFSSSMPSGGSLGNLGGVGGGGPGSFGSTPPIQQPTFINSPNYGQQPPQQPQTAGEQLGGFFTAAALGSVQGLKDTAKASGNKKKDYYEWNKLGTKGAIFGGVYIFLGFLMLMLKVFTGHGGLWQGFMVGGVLTSSIFLGIGVVFHNKLREDPKTAARIGEGHIENDDFNMDVFDSEETEDSEEGLDDWLESLESNDEESDFNFEGGEEVSWEDEEVDDVDDLDLWGDFEETTTTTTVAVTPAVSPEEALASVTEMTPGMFTRSFLFEKFNSILNESTPDFAQWTEISPESAEFEEHEETIIQSALQLGIDIGEHWDDDHKRLQLLKMEQNKFMIRYTISRPPSVTKKEQQIADEMAAAYSDDGRGRHTPGVFSQVYSSPGKFYVNLFTGPIKSSISLKDVYLTDDVKEFTLDNDKVMPVSIGVNEYGEVHKSDFFNQDSIIVSGKPRTGKSWFVSLLLLQMANYLPPSELQFLILDAKEGYSTFNEFKLPHMLDITTPTKDGVSGIDFTPITDKLRWIFNEEQYRRAEMLKEAGVNKIQDYNKLNPNDKMPYLYVVIDEMMALAGGMDADKEMKAEYRGYVSSLVSQLPALGIRPIFIPHRVTDHVIPTNASRMVQCFVAVGADEEGLRDIPGYKPAKFKYTLSQIGEMAIKIRGIENGEIVYSRSLVMAQDDAQLNTISAFVGDMWRHLDPSFDGMAEIESREAMEAKTNFDNLPEAPLSVATTTQVPEGMQPPPGSRTIPYTSSKNKERVQTLPEDFSSFSTTQTPVEEVGHEDLLAGVEDDLDLF